MTQGTSAISLRENTAVQELMGILRSNSMDKQLKDFTELINHVDTMEGQLNTVLSELNNVRKQLDEIKDKQHPIRTACLKMQTAIKTNVKEAQVKLVEVKDSVVAGTKKALEAFKEKGIAALNGVMNFLKVDKVLNSLRNSIDKSIASAEKSIVKIETMSTEMHSAGSHIRNFGRALTGKETKNDVKENGKIMKVVQSPFRFTKATMSGIRKAVNSIITKFGNLDKTAKDNKEKAVLKKEEKEAAKKEEKPSILDNVKNFKPPQKTLAAAGIDNSKKKEETSL